MRDQSFDTFRNNVRAILAEREISLRTFAAQLRTSHAYLSRLLSGQSVPGIDRCDEIAQQLGVPLSSLLQTENKISA